MTRPLIGPILTIEETADALGLSEATTRSHLRHARQRLRKQLTTAPLKSIA
ncbi:RNA polymerase sigma factor [Streptomyces sp. NBC_00828]|uniref:RNA polymerase sigma factor n=1 Tax=Streptomyces sp. NBC_00828 TaxID=2903678 RepID=UPI003869558C